MSRTDAPEGFWKNLILYGTNRMHARALNWGLSDLERAASPGESTPGEIVELGCGSGKNVRVLHLRYPNARITAVDDSPYTIETATSHNRQLILEGKCAVIRSSFSNLQLEENQFDLAVAFETIYDWPDLQSCFSQARKVLKPGGRILITNETDGNDAVKIRYEKNNMNMISYSAEEIETALCAAGFSRIHAEQHPSESWIAVMAVKEEEDSGTEER